MTRAYLLATRVLGTLLLVAGLTMAATALLNGGGPLAAGVIIGVAFVLAGGGRLWLTYRGGP